MRFKFKPRNTRKQKIKIILPAILLSAVCSVYIFQLQLRPIIREYASIQAQNAVYALINQQVEDTLSTQNITYDSLITLVRDADGRVCALTTNVSAMNNFKTKVTALILDEMQKLTQASFDIPLGLLTGSELLSGRGPNISLKITPVSAIESSYSNDFTSAGINQTRHQIMMNFSAEIGLLLPGYNDKTKINLQVCIAETIIVGAAPQFFAAMGYTENIPTT